jgi:hypothetical protein
MWINSNSIQIASGEGHGSRGETLHPICDARPVSSSAEHTVESDDEEEEVTAFQ